jgi:hypothetical protein
VGKNFHEIFALMCLLVAIAYPCVGREKEVLCENGSGRFQEEFQSSGLSVLVRASRDGELANRKCEAELSWSKQDLIVATDAAQIDLDAFGVDLGTGNAIAAFQVKQSDAACCMQYQIYSLTNPPRLVRTITGGSYFSAGDTDLDGRVEIRTDDSAAVDGFEGLTLAELHDPPTIVLRFSGGKVLDVSSEFKSDFDSEIERLRRTLTVSDLRGFMRSDGKLSAKTPLPAEEMHHLRQAKSTVLEIVWNYLYSDREQEAWRALVEMWPTADVKRIQAEIVKVRARGIGAQVDGSSSRSLGRKRHAMIFDFVSQEFERNSQSTAAKPILLTRPAVSTTSGQVSSGLELAMVLVVDSAGKVRSAESEGKATLDPELVRATAGWKFIPAFKDRKAVACRMRLAVSMRQ